MINHLSLQGRLVADPEIRDANSGVKVANFRVAWSERFKDKENKCFLECKAFSGLAEHIGRYFTKGQEIVVEGKLHTDEWEKEGQKRSKNVLLVSTVHFCGSKKEGGNNDISANVTPVENEELPF